MITRFKEQKDRKGKTVYKHLLACGAREEVSDERDLDIRAARQSQIFSAGDYFDAFFDAEHENHKKKIL